MRRIALYSDVHANLPALEAVLADIAGQGIEKRYCLGDLVGYGPHPSEVVGRVREIGDPVVQGNYDRAIGGRLASPGGYFLTDQEMLDGAESYAYTIASVNSGDAAYLLGLPEGIRLDVDGVHILLCHATPRLAAEVVESDAPAAELVALIEQASAHVVCCGHVHIPFHRALPTGQGHLHWINAGSVGRPRDGDPRAAWVELVAGGQDEVLALAAADVACRRVGASDLWLSTIVQRVAYEIEPVVHEMLSLGLPLTLASGLRTGLEQHDRDEAVQQDSAPEIDDDDSPGGLWACEHDGRTCTCAINDRIAAYEALARIYRGDVAEVGPAVSRLREAMRTCRVSLHVDEAAVLTAFEGASGALRSATGREAFVVERQRLYGGRAGFDPFSNVLSPDEYTYLTEDRGANLVALEGAYREAKFTIPDIGGSERSPGDIATELSFMAHCLRAAASGDLGAAGRARTFFADHLSSWGVIFAVVVSREAREPVMRYAGLALDKFLTCEAATFRYSLAGCHDLPPLRP